MGADEPWIKTGADLSRAMKNPSTGRNISLVAPLFTWALIIVIGIIFEAIVPAVLGATIAPGATLYRSIGNYILYLPGVIILPLLISIWIGHKVGDNTESVRVATKLGVINAVYASIVYAVIIFIAYLILSYTSIPARYMISQHDFIVFMVGVPIAIVLVFSTLIAVLDRIRK